MSKKKEAVWGIMARLRPDLKAPVTRIATKKRWSINDFIEESVILGIAEYGEKNAAQKQSS